MRRPRSRTKMERITDESASIVDLRRFRPRRRGVRPWPGLESPAGGAWQGDRSQIEQIVIHPAIGVARVGNSPHEWFLGPETAGPHPVPPGGFKDAAGR